MSEETVYKKFRLSTAYRVVSLCLALVFLIGGLALYFIGPQVIGGLRDPQLRTVYSVATLVIAAFSAVVVLSSVIALLTYDASPLLIIDGEGITDYRDEPEPRHIPWGRIQSMDSEVTTLNGTVTNAKLFLFVLMPDGRVEEVPVKLGGLDVSPGKLARAAKRRWLEAMQQPQDDVGD